MPARIGRAVALMVLVAAAGVAVSGLADAAGKDGLRLPGVAAGDAADYEGPARLRVTQQGLGVEQDARGRHVLAWHVAETRTSVEDDQAVVVETAVHAWAGGQPLLSRLPTGETSHITSFESQGGSERLAEATAVYADISFGMARSLCGVPAGPDPRTLAWSGDVHLEGDCGGPLRHAGTNGGRSVFANDEVEVAFEADMPFPVAVKTEHGTYTLARTGRAPVPLLAQASSPDPVLPVIEMAPATRLGPDGSGMRQDFGLEAAVDAARNDVEEPRIRDYLAAHPDWFVSQASSATAEQGMTMVWSITFDSSGPPIGAIVRRLLPEAPGLPVPRPGSPVPLQPPVGMPYPLHDGFDVQVLPADQDLPAAASPHALPNPADVAAAWRAYTGSEEPHLDWGFQADCPPGCQALVYAVRAGNATSLHANSGEDLGVHRWTDSSLVVDMSGAIVGRYERHVEEDRTEGPAPLVSGWSGTHPDGAAQPSALAGALTAPSTAGWVGITAASVLAGVAYLAVAAAQAGGFSSLFSRVVGPAVLDHAVRRRIVAAVAAQPGVHHQALQRACMIGRGSLDHHLRKLVDAGAVTRHRSAGYTCFFPGRVDPTHVAAAGALKADGAKRIWEAVRAHPGSRAGQVARIAGVDPSTVTHHVRRLQDAGLVEAHREGRTVTLHPRDRMAPPRTGARATEGRP